MASSQNTCKEPELSKKRSEVIERNKLGEARTILIRLPKTLKFGNFKDGNRICYFYQYCIPAKNGVINFFLRDWHTVPHPYEHAAIKAKAEIWQKKLEDGRAYLYVDLYSLESGALVTHHLKVHGQPVFSRNKLEVFDIPPPLQGSIVLTPIE